jgi:hypothetical protein
MSAFADDTFIPKANASLPLLIKDMEKTPWGHYKMAKEVRTYCEPGKDRGLYISQTWLFLA